MQKHLMNFIKKHRKFFKISIVIILSIIVICALIYIKFFYNIEEGFECVTYKHFGILCMGCGSTRQLYYLLNGDLKSAITYNIGAIIIYPAYTYLYYLILRWGLFDKKIKTKQAYILAIIAGILLLYMILRNIPIRAFAAFRPPV